MNTKNDNEKDIRLDGNVKIETPFLKKLENFWYHHKFGTLVSIFIVTAVIICSVQLFQKKNHDIYVMYAGPAALSFDLQKSIMTDLTSLADDYNNDGDTVVNLQALQVMTGTQWKNFVKKNDAETDANKKYDSTTLGMMLNSINSNAEMFEQELFTGDAVICFLDPGQYNDVLAADGFLTLEEVLGYKPEEAIDDYCVRLRDTPFGSYFGSLKSLPSDTVVCVRKISPMASIWNQKQTAEYHGYALEFFRKLYSFEVKSLS